MNRTVSTLIILICVVFFGIGTFWYVQIRPKPIIEYLPPVGSEFFPRPLWSGVPTTTLIQQSKTPDAPSDTRSWSERLNNKELPDLGEIKLKTYTDTVYGFTLQYPAGWGVQKFHVRTSEGVVFEFFDSKFPSKGNNMVLNIYKGILRSQLAQTDSEWAKRIRTHGFIPDATIDGLDAFIRYPKGNSHDTLLDLSFQKNGFIYSFGETLWTNNRDKIIIEYIVKTFHSPAPIQPQAPLDIRSWRKRFLDKTIPQVPGITWQTYINKEFGFQMEYPKEWSIEKDQTVSSKFPPVLYKKNGVELLRVAISRGELRKHLVEANLFWADRINTYGFIPDAILNGMNIFIYYPEDNSQDTLLELHLKQNGFNYNFFESFNPDNKYKIIIEHMIKTLRFLE